MVTFESDDWVEFCFLKSDASEVYLAGDFNSWRPGELPMHRDASGRWRGRMRLPSGKFRFRYWADGQWFTDYAAFGVECTPHGFVGVVCVPPGSHRRSAGSQKTLRARPGPILQDNPLH